MKNEETVDGIYNSIAINIQNPRQRQSLERVKAACDYLVASGIKVTPTTVENYCIDRGWDGPKAQSIRNSRDVLFKYVNLRSSGQMAHSQSRRVQQEPLIKDESLKAYVQMLVHERDQACANLSRVQAGLRKIPGVPVDDLIRMGFGGEKSDLAPDNKLSHSLVCALRALLDSDNLDRCGLELHKERLRQVATRNVLLEKQHVLSIQSALKSVEIETSPNRSKRWNPQAPSDSDSLSRRSLSANVDQE